MMDFKILGICAIIIAGLFWVTLGQAETIGQQKGTIKGHEATIKYEDKIGGLVKDHTKALNLERDTNATNLATANAETNQWKLTAEKQSQTDPTAFGDDFDLWIKRWMCRVGGGLDDAQIKVCDTADEGSFTSGLALTFSVNQALAEEWGEHCDDYRDSLDPDGEGDDTEESTIPKDWADFCRWSISGFNPQGLAIFKDYARAMEAKQRELLLENKGLRETLKIVTETANAEG